MKTKPKSKTLKLIAEEIPKLRLLMDELLETLDVMGSKEELEAIKESLEQVRRDETRDWDEYAGGKSPLLKDLYALEN